MKQRIRVERAVTDSGYGYGWVVLGPTGATIAHHTMWWRAFEVAYWYAQAFGVQHER